MGGLAVLILLGTYLWIAHKSVRAIPSRWGKALTIIAFVLVPTADAVYGRIKLRQMCAAEGGLKITKTAQGVEGFYVDRLGPTLEWVTKYGYRFVEGESLGGKPMRLSRGPNGKILEEKNVVLQSRYRYEYSGGDFGGGYAYGEQRIRDLQTNEILARARNISYEGGWVERFIAKFSDSRSGFAGACEEGANRVWPDQIVRETLKPINE